jgi:hypothetical protein
VGRTRIHASGETPSWKDRLPQLGADRDIFERLYAVRLERLRNSEECRTLLEPLDSQGLLDSENDANFPLDDDLDDEEIDAALLASLGVDATSDTDVTKLTHVRSRSVAPGKSRQEIKAAEEIAQRTPCEDFPEAENRSTIHKIGVTTGDVKTRVANAKKDPTYLLADVEIVCTFKLEAIAPKRLEALLHKFFAAARLELNLPDRFNIPVQPREWFLVPLEVIEKAIEKIQDGTLEQFQYEPETASLRQV